MANVQIDNTAQGLQIGKAATDPIGIWGATPAPQPSGANQAAVGALTATAIAAANATTPGTGADGTTPSGAEYTTCAVLANELKVDYTALLADVTSIRTLVNELRSALVAAGIIKGAA